MKNNFAVFRLGLILTMLLTAGILTNPGVSSAAAPAAPQLDYPSNGMNAGGTVIPFRWQQVDGAYNYYLQVATDAGFTNVIFGSWVGNYIGIDMSGFPDNGRTYYWRVAPGNSLGSSNYSGTWSFVTGPSDIPDIPVLTSPLDNANVQGTTIEFRWEPAARANDYYFEVATDAGLCQYRIRPMDRQFYRYKPQRFRR